MLTYLSNDNLSSKYFWCDMDGVVALCQSDHLVSSPCISTHTQTHTNKWYMYIYILVGNGSSEQQEFCRCHIHILCHIVMYLLACSRWRHAHMINGSLKWNWLGWRQETLGPGHFADKPIYTAVMVNITKANTLFLICDQVLTKQNNKIHLLLCSVHFKIGKEFWFNSSSINDKMIICT